MRILTQHGDEPLEWDPADKASVAAARKKFDELKKDGYRFYEVQESRGKAVEKFDAKLGKIIAAPGAATAVDKATGSRPAAMRGGPNTRTVALR